jgi:hypothetical protein
MALQAAGGVDHLVRRGAFTVNMDQLPQLNYLDACPNESMRLKPVAPLIVLQVAEVSSRRCGRPRRHVRDVCDAVGGLRRRTV